MDTVRRIRNEKETLQIKKLGGRSYILFRNSNMFIVSNLCEVRNERKNNKRVQDIET